MRHAPRRQAGFTLVELAVVAGVLGLLAIAMTSAFDSMGQAREHNAAQAQAESARQALRHFALRSKRLPCPDTSTYGDAGREAAGAGSCPPGTTVGWLPYEALGLQVPVRAQRLRYGVRRDPGADLVAPIPYAVDGPDLEGGAGLATSLALAATTPASTAQPYYATSTATSSGADCTGTVLVNPAFVVVAPVTDRDGASDTHPGFDGPNRAFADGAGTCVGAPDRAANAHYDDIVVAESATALLGWLTAAIR